MGVFQVVPSLISSRERKRMERHLEELDWLSPDRVNDLYRKYCSSPQEGKETDMDKLRMISVKDSVARETLRHNLQKRLKGLSGGNNHSTYDTQLGNRQLEERPEAPNTSTDAGPKNYLSRLYAGIVISSAITLGSLAYIYLQDKSPEAQQGPATVPTSEQPPAEDAVNLGIVMTEVDSLSEKLNEYKKKMDDLEGKMRDAYAKGYGAASRHYESVIEGMEKARIRGENVGDADNVLQQGAAEPPAGITSPAGGLDSLYREFEALYSLAEQGEIARVRKDIVAFREKVDSYIPANKQEKRRLAALDFRYTALRVRVRD